jgi:hypothetical protein
LPSLCERFGAEDGLKGALVAIDAIAINPSLAQAIATRLAVGGEVPPTLRAEDDAAFAAAEDQVALSGVSALETDGGFSRREDFWFIVAVKERR